ncbi:YeiH family protein [Lentibacillus sp. CBA3610]|uniref:YeiH family protein n=1 Tax=Lentibacillus sp. CBA3610 TaxID=2518176 RepID=UPI001594F852|nr:YeiH family protein [Lentibacillus sp. CBA3610]QKY71697.1 YeiH family putative sulfate export transporter [Lentibacillus sp. CBA3610]
MRKNGFILGIGLTLFLALIAQFIAYLPIFEIIGSLVLAIVLGIVWRVVFYYPSYMAGGITFSSKKILRLGIILLGMRLNLLSIVEAGFSVVITAVVVIAVTIFVIYKIGSKLELNPNIGLLTACGTGICGAAAIVAIAPQVKAKDDEVAISVATIAMLGTLFTFIYVLIFPFLNIESYTYGFFAGATLHELAHVIAAADPGGSTSVDIAVIMKLTRVALLVPVAIIIGLMFARKNRTENAADRKFSLKSLPIPWFIIGFLATSAIYTTGILPTAVSDLIVSFSYLLIGMAMAGLGLNVDLNSFKQYGLKSFKAGLAGTVILVFVGAGLVWAVI